MGMQISNVFIDSFDAEVKLAYQADKALRDTVRVKTGVIGSTHRFPVAGSGVATEHNRGNDVIAMNASRDKVTATLTDWDAFDYEDIMDIEKINFDDKKIIANNTAKAIGRREDQLIIDALDTGSTTTVGDGNAAFSLILVQSAARTLDALNVPSEDRCIIYTAKQKEQFLGSTTVTSSDFNTVKALVAGDIDTFYGFKFITVGARTEGGLPRPAGVEQDCYAYHKQAIGLAIGKDMTSMVDWIAEKLAWQIGCVYSAGAIVIDAEGIVTIHTDDSP